MINRDDWLSPAAFVARIDLEAKPVDDPEHARKLSKLKDRFLENLELADAPADAKIGTQLRIRLPKDYYKSSTDNSWMA